MLHPGGVAPLKDVAGQDATELFYSLHRADVLLSPRYQRLRVGTLAGGVPAPLAGSLPVVPYGEAMGYWRTHSPYYNESHARLRAGIRSFLDEHVRPDSVDADENEVEVPLELNLKMGAAGIIAALFAAHPAELERCGLAGSLPGGVSVDEWDLFHSLIVAEEVKRLGCYGYSDGLVGGQSIGLPPVLNFGSDDLKARIVPAVLRGEKRICLCISEPYAGSDVSKVRCRAVKSKDGSHYVVNGVKKWITGGYWADYFTTLCQSDEGMVLLLVEKQEGLSTKRIKTSYSATAGTAYVMYDDCVVPAGNLIGKTGAGFMHVMQNFNNERWGMIGGGNRLSRLMVEEAFKWAMQVRQQQFEWSRWSLPVARTHTLSLSLSCVRARSLSSDGLCICHVSVSVSNLRIG